MSALPRENVQSYPRPPALEPVAERLSVHFGGAEIAATTRGYRVLETHHAPTYYLPPEDVAEGVLRPVSGSTICEWKGRARYFDVVHGGASAPRAAWCFPDPNPGFRAIAGYVAFYAGPMDACYVGEVRVIPQPGSFYGGWLTPNLDGTIKGAAGTEHW